MKGSTKGWRRVLLPALLLVSSTALGFLSVEIAYRYHLYSRMKNAPTYYAANDSIYEYSRDFGFTHLPGKSIVEVKVERGYPVLWNERFTDASGNMTRVKRDSVRRDCRVLVLGDSYTAYQREGSTWPDFLQDRLDGRYPGKFEIVNCGRISYGVLQMFDLAGAKIRELQPDLVIVAFITDDLRRCRFWMTAERGNGDLRVTKRMAPREEENPAPFVDSFLVHPALTGGWCTAMLKSRNPEDPLLKELHERYRRVIMESRYRNLFFTPSASLVLNRILHGDAFHGLMRHFREPALEPEAYRRDARFLSRVSELNASRVPYVLVHVPTYRDLKAGKYILKKEEEALLQSLRELTGRNIVSLLEYAADPGDDLERLYLLPHDGHPSRKGHEYYADAVYSLLAREGMAALESGGRDLAALSGI